MRESELLSHIYARSADLHGRGPVMVGPGDDAAAVRTDGGPLLITVDQLVEGRHFTPGTPIDLIARKAVARSVSDIAAMGGTPAWGLATGVLPEGFSGGNELFDAMHRWARHWNAPLVGGDIASGPAGAPLVLSTTVAGAAHPGRGPVLRSGARAGDEVWVTGRFGGSFASGRHLSFEPRVREGAWLCDRLGPGLRAMLDVSDGLGRDAARIAAASGVRIELRADLLPRHPEVTDWRQAAGDGEDYELCFTVAPGASLPPDIDGVPLTRVGGVVAGSGCVISGPDGGVHDASQLGWDHHA